MTTSARQRQHDRQHADLARAVNQILWAWPHAVLDAESRGFSSGNTGTSTGRVADPTAACALEAVDHRPGSLTDALIQARAEIWLAEWRRLAAMICVDTGRRLPPWGPDRAASYLRAAVAELPPPIPEPLCRRLYRLADQALAWWPPAPKITVNGKTRNAALDDSDDMCALCGLPAPGGKDAKGRLQRRRLDGMILHATKPTTSDDEEVDARAQAQACYWIVYRQRRQVS